MSEAMWLNQPDPLFCYDHRAPKKLASFPFLTFSKFKRQPTTLSTKMNIATAKMLENGFQSCSK